VTATAFDERLARIETGETLTAADIQELSTAPDIVSLGMLADTLRRRLRGTQTTYLRVATCAFDDAFVDAVLPAAREISIAGAPPTPAVALSAVQTAKAVAGERLVSGLTWADVERLGAQYQGGVPAFLRDLRSAGLEGLAELALDAPGEMEKPLAKLQQAGFERLRLTVDGAEGVPRADLWVRASALQRRFGIIAALNPLPMMLRTFRPTTGYEDVRNVAVARLAAPNIPRIQVDWTRYGPKLAQVALTFGADDVWGVSSSEAAPDGRRRAAIAEIRRNIEAAGFEPVERDGRYGVIG
jgi:aminodeoxyfutalosine synthase